MVGWVVRILTGREGNSAYERRLRSLHNMFEVERNATGARAAAANHFFNTLDEKLEAVQRQLRIALAGQAPSPRHINQAECAGDGEWSATLNDVLNG
jgi:hypothetical protein